MGKISVKFDNKGFEELYKQLDEMEEYEVEAGYYGDDIHSKAEMPMSNLAWIHENGTDEIPERPFMSQATHAMQGGSVVRDELYNIIFKGASVKKELVGIGKKMENQITLAIEYGSFLPNAKLTVALKGRDEPLIETSEMKDNPKSKVIRKEADE